LLVKANKLAGIEAGRGVAALLVVAVHTRDHVFKNYGVPVPLGDWFLFGHAGVDFFFVLSGFIIAWVHGRDICQPSRLSHYVERRFTRIFPFYWIVCLITLGMLALSAHAEFPTATRTALSLVLAPYGVTPFVSVAWTLQHEILFYVLFAILILDRRLGAGLMALWFAASILHVVDGWAEGDAVVSAFNVQFLFGLGAAWLLKRQRIPAPLTLLCLGIGVFVVAAGIEDVGLVPGPSLLPHLGYTIGATLAILGIVESERQGRLRVPALMASLGGASYSIYLTHLICLGIAWQIMLRLHLASVLPLWAHFLILFTCAATGGWILSVTIEHPVMSLVRNLIRRSHPVVSPAPADGVR